MIPYYCALATHNIKRTNKKAHPKIFLIQPTSVPSANLGTCQALRNYCDTPVEESGHFPWIVAKPVDWSSLDRLDAETHRRSTETPCCSRDFWGYGARLPFSSVRFPLPESFRTWHNLCSLGLAGGGCRYSGALQCGTSDPQSPEDAASSCTNNKEKFR